MVLSDGQLSLIFPVSVRFHSSSLTYPSHAPCMCDVRASQIHGACMCDVRASVHVCVRACVRESVCIYVCVCLV